MPGSSIGASVVRPPQSSRSKWTQRKTSSESLGFALFDGLSDLVPAWPSTETQKMGLWGASQHKFLALPQQPSPPTGS